MGGFDSNGILTGYQPPLYKLAKTDGIELTFIGTQTGGPTLVDGKNFTWRHDGYPGYTTTDIDDYLPTLLNVIDASPPAVVTIMLGTNDTFSGWPNSAAKKLSDIVEGIHAKFPDAYIILAKVIPATHEFVQFNWDIDSLNTEIEKLVQQKIDQGKPVLLVDMHGPFISRADYTAAYLPDGIHPNNAGYALMADVWYAAVKPLLQGCADF
jgi:lysophospholipase L1-like esterase